MNLVNLSPMTLGDRLKKARLALGWTQEQTAKKMNTYQQRYAHWEVGTTRPDPDEIKKLSEVLDVSADWLLGKHEEATPYPSDMDKELHLLREEIKKYGAPGIRRVRMMIPYLLENSGIVSNKTKREAENLSTTHEKALQKLTKKTKKQKTSA